MCQHINFLWVNIYIENVIKQISYEQGIRQIILNKTIPEPRFCLCASIYMLSPFQLVKSDLIYQNYIKNISENALYGHVFIYQSNSNGIY